MNNVRKYDSHHIVADGPLRAAAIVSSLQAAGVRILAFSISTGAGEKSQLDLMTEDTGALSKAVIAMGVSLRQGECGLLLEGDDPPGALTRLFQANLGVTACQAVSTTAGRFAALCWMPRTHRDLAANLLSGETYLEDTVDEASEESFPASDSPAWSLAPHV